MEDICDGQTDEKYELKLVKLNELKKLNMENYY